MCRNILHLSFCVLAVLIFNQNIARGAAPRPLPTPPSQINKELGVLKTNLTELKSKLTVLSEKLVVLKVKLEPQILLAQIKAGKKLKPASARPLPNPPKKKTDSRQNLLESIRGNIKLKPAQDRVLNPITNKPEDVGAKKEVLGRRDAIQDDSDDDSDDEPEDEDKNLFKSDIVDSAMQERDSLISLLNLITEDKTFDENISRLLDFISTQKFETLALQDSEGHFRYKDSRRVVLDKLKDSAMLIKKQAQKDFQYENVLASSFLDAQFKDVVTSVFKSNPTVKRTDKLRLKVRYKNVSEVLADRSGAVEKLEKEQEEKRKKQSAEDCENVKGQSLSQQITAKTKVTEPEKNKRLLLDWAKEKDAQLKSLPKEITSENLNDVLKEFDQGGLDQIKAIAKKRYNLTLNSKPNEQENELLKIIIDFVIPADSDDWNERVDNFY